MGVAINEMTVAALVVFVVSVLCAAGSPPGTCYLEIKGPRYDHLSVCLVNCELHEMQG